jgi:protein-ribulosamine 3-kinase
MKAPEAVERWLQEQGFGAVSGTRPVGGGCINNGARLQTTSGQSFFLKTNADAPADMFAREAEGLQELRVSGGPRVPQPFLDGQSFLLLEDLDPGRQRSDYWLAFGRQLAALHDHTGDQFGFAHDNYIGSTPQPNPRTDNGYQFFGEQRLMFQAHLARQRGLLNQNEVSLVEHLVQRLPELLPAQPASLIHGDLWSGNAITDAQGQPALIDPAAHFGWAEAELGMTALFGGFPQAFYQAYLEARPLEAGLRERFPIYNLYHLLNHLNLFGGGYYGQVISILRRYS